VKSASTAREKAKSESKRESPTPTFTKETSATVEGVLEELSQLPDSETLAVSLNLSDRIATNLDHATDRSVKPLVGSSSNSNKVSV